MKKLHVVALAGLVAAGLACSALHARYGGGVRFPDRSTAAALPASALELVATLREPPGNIAVSATGRVFVTIHPASNPRKNKVVEIVNGEAVPFPDDEAQRSLYRTPQGIRIDRLGRLWTIDDGGHGRKGARLAAVDIASGKVVHQHDFNAEIAPLGSFLQDLSVSPDGATVYLSDASILRKSPAIIVYDTRSQTARRALDKDASTLPQDYSIQTRSGPLVFLGCLVTLKVGVDSIALDDRGEWLYFAPINHESMFRVRAAALNDPALGPGELSSRVEVFGPKVLTAGISVDDRGNLYMTDVEHSAISRLGDDRALTTWIRDERIRWPDGLGFGPDGWMYIADSDLPDLVLQSRAHVEAAAPFSIFRFKPGTTGVPGQ